MRRVLLISYVFPPMAAVGGMRVTKFAKFLPQFGWQPTVLTVREGFNYSYDPARLKDLDPSVKIYRSRNLDPLQWWDRRTQPSQESSPQSSPPATSVPNKPGPQADSFVAKVKRTLRACLSLPDSHMFWVPFAVATGLRAIKREQIEVIFSSSPPASSHLVAWLLAKLSGKPLVLDYRDLWTLNDLYHRRPIPIWLRRIDRSLERRVNRRAGAMITATTTFAKQMRQHWGETIRAEIGSITNGVDPDEMDGLDLPTRKNDKFTLVHLGSLYANRSPDFIFRAMATWLKARPEIAPMVELQLVGNTPTITVESLEPPLNTVVTKVDFLARREALTKLWEADLLLILMGFEPEGRGVIPAKIFEYVCTGLPILAFAPIGEVSAVLDKYEPGCLITEPDVEKTVAYLNEQYDLWERSPQQRESQVQIPAWCDRKDQTRALVEILDGVLADRK